MFLFRCTGKIRNKVCPSSFQDSRLPKQPPVCQTDGCPNVTKPLQLTQRRVEYPVNKDVDTDLTNCSIMDPDSIPRLSRVTNTQKAVDAGFERIRSETDGLIPGMTSYTITRPAPPRARYFPDWVGNGVEWKSRLRARFGTKFAVVEYEACVNIDQAHELKDGKVGAPDTPHVGWDLSIRVISFSNGGATFSEAQETKVGHILVDWVPYHRDLDASFVPNYEAVPWRDQIPAELKGPFAAYQRKKQEERDKSNKG